MTSTIRRRFSMLPLVLGLTLVTPTLAAPVVGQEAGTCDRGWYDVERREDIAPEGVIAFDAAEPWVAGGTLLGGGRRTSAVLRGLGDGAVLEEPPPPDTRDSGLMALAAAGPDAPIWAVGFGRETDYVAAYVTRRDDDGWGRTETLRPNGFNAALTDVDASLEGGVWAAGFLQGQPGDQRPWVVELREDRREATRPPLDEGERATLAGISVSDDGGVWVAGTALGDATMRPYLAARDGDGWQRHVVAGLEGAALADIEVLAADRGWAVGHRLVNGLHEPLLLRWDGAAWTEVRDLVVERGPTLLTSVAEADGVVSVGGTTWHEGKHRFSPLVARREGDEWSVSLGRSGWGMGTITDISGDPGTTGWAVGRADEGIITRVCDEPTATRQASISDLAPIETDPLEPPEPEALRGPVVAVDVTESAGLPTAHQSWGATAADFDGDGDDDLFIGRHGARARLHLNEDGTFVDSELRFGGGDRHACAAADIDGSGLPDLYCAFGASRGTGTKHNQLWLDPGGDGGGQLHATAGGATEPLGRGRQPRFFDIDDDGALDLFVGQETKRMDGQPSTNRGFLQSGPAAFRATPLPGIDDGLATEAIDIGDYDGDGREDMLLVYWDKRAVAPRAGIRLYRNEPGLAFTDVTAQTGIESIAERDALLAELDGDGQLDLVQLSADRAVVSLMRDGSFERVWEQGLSEGTAVAAGDADGDGDVDLYVLQGKSDAGAHDIILRNAGDGTSFQTIEVPAVRGGSEDDVIALDYDTDGRADFLALNGRNSVRGPVQLVTLEERD